MVGQQTMYHFSVSLGQKLVEVPDLSVLLIVLFGSDHYHHVGVVGPQTFINVKCLFVRDQLAVANAERFQSICLRLVGQKGCHDQGAEEISLA